MTVPSPDERDAAEGVEIVAGVEVGDRQERVRATLSVRRQHGLQGGLESVALAAGAGCRVARQGDPGDELFIIVSGKVIVREGAADRSERTVGEVVGEMSIITQEPRIASLIAVDQVRVLGLDRTEFEGMLRERPAISLAVMRVLIARLKESEAKARQPDDGGTP